MPIINVTNNIQHPLEECLPSLQEIVEEIKDRQLQIYNVPYNELNEIVIALIPNPDEDIAAFNETYAYIQSYINRISTILISVRKELKIWNIFKLRLKVIYRKAKNNLLINDPSIKALRNKDMQEAAIQEKIPELTDLLEGLDIIIEGLEHDEYVVKIKKEQLDTANVNLNRQQKVVEDMIGLNMVYKETQVHLKTKNSV